MAGKAKFDQGAAFKSIIGADRRPAEKLQEKIEKTQKNKDRVPRAYFLDRDIDKALRRMALEEGKNLTESVNDALRVGVKKYL